MEVKQYDDGQWWIESPAIDQGAAGPYSTETEATEDRRGLTAFFREHPSYRADLPEEFRLESPKPPVKREKPAEFESRPAQQKVLFTGLDCLPGQLDLFNTDSTKGEP